MFGYSLVKVKLVLYMYEFLRDINFAIFAVKLSSAERLLAKLCGFRYLENRMHLKWIVATFNSYWQ